MSWKQINGDSESRKQGFVNSVTRREDQVMKDEFEKDGKDTCGSMDFELQNRYQSSGHVAAAETGFFVFYDSLHCAASRFCIDYPYDFLWRGIIFTTIREFLGHFKKRAKSKCTKAGEEVAFAQSYWNGLVYSKLVEGLTCKFKSSKELTQQLLSSGSRNIVYANEKDTLFGIGLSHNDISVGNPMFWKGKNLLGYALMEVRATLREELKQNDLKTKIGKILK